MLLRRIISSIVLIPTVSIPAYLGGPIYGVVVFITALLAANEFADLLRRGNHPPIRSAGLALIGLFLLDASYPSIGVVRYGVPLFIMLTFAYILRATDLTGALINWSLTIAGSLYIGGLMAQFIALRQLSLGLELLALTAFVTWSSDVSAYAFGMTLGRHQLAPRISPKKSWEGAIGGGLTALFVGVMWGLFALPNIATYHLIALSALIVVAGIVGDLSESFIKRQIGVKDAGAFIPGHGGVLDRLDSLLFAIPTTLLYAVWVLRLR